RKTAIAWFLRPREHARRASELRRARVLRGSTSGGCRMNSVWVLVCDASRGRIFQAHDDASPWRLVESFVHDESRSKAVDLVSDREGRSSSRGGSVHHNALAPTSSLK